MRQPRQPTPLTTTTVISDTTMTACSQSVLPRACISAHWPAKPAVSGMPARLNTPKRKAAEVQGRRVPTPWMALKSLRLPARWRMTAKP